MRDRICTPSKDDAAGPLSVGAESCIVGQERLRGLQADLMRLLDGGPDVLTGLRADLSKQRPLGRQGARLPVKGLSGIAESSRARGRQNVAGEGTAGRTGPPENFQRHRQDTPDTLEPSASLRGRSAESSGLTQGHHLPAIR